ncbi:hypothetical protein [Laspinema palackyanum]
MEGNHPVPPVKPAVLNPVERGLETLFYVKVEGALAVGSGTG